MDAPAVPLDPGRMSRAALLVLVLVSTAAADGDHVSGFITYGAGQLRGRVLDHGDKPVGGERVHVVSSSGAEQIVATDRDGRFRAELRGGIYTMVYVQADAHVTGEVTLPTVEGNAEVVEIHETIPPAVAVPKTNPELVPEYSDAAIDRNVWTRAWLMLDVDETGSVVRLKLLRRPGFDLDAIATRDAFKLKFQPARDRANRPIRTLVIWGYEWPSYWWMQRHHNLMTRLPPEVGSVPCRDGTPMHPEYRDCSQPDVATAMREAWIASPTNVGRAAPP
jgi:hypothetical protein